MSDIPEDIKVRIIELKRFLMPLEIERRWEVNSPRVIAYLVYWTPYGDECVVIRFYRNGMIMGGTSDWTAFFLLERLNPILTIFDLGSSDTEPEWYLLVDKIHNKFYLVPAGTKKEEILRIIGVEK